MKNSYIRLSQLWNNLSLPPEDNLPDKAEIMAYCKGIKIVREFFYRLLLKLQAVQHCHIIVKCWGLTAILHLMKRRD